MKVLLDENLPHELRHLLVGHDVFTTAYMGWTSLKNGRLIAAAAAVGFELMITVDRGIEFQQNLAKLPLTVLLLVVPSNERPTILSLAADILERIPTLTPRSFTKISVDGIRG